MVGSKVCDTLKMSTGIMMRQNIIATRPKIVIDVGMMFNPSFLSLNAKVPRIEKSKTTSNMPARTTHGRNRG